MKVREHRVQWPKRYNSWRADLDFKVTDVDCFVRKVGHPCAGWAVGEAWHRVSAWFEKKGAVVTLGDPVETDQWSANEGAGASDVVNDLAIMEAIDFARGIRQNAYKRLMETGDEYWKGELVVADAMISKLIDLRM